MYLAGRIGVLAALTMLFAGCGATLSSPTHSSPDDSQESPAAHGPKLAAADVNLVIGDEKKLAEMLTAHKGKVVFVDYWATWCHQCKELFPHTVETHHRYKDRDYATIAVSMDTLEEEPQVREFLASQDANFDNLMSNYDDVGQDVANAFEFDVLPQFRLYDRTGKVRYEWKDKPEDLDQRIEELLAEQG